MPRGAPEPAEVSQSLRRDRPQKCRTRPRSSSSGRPSAAATQPIRSGRLPKRAKTRPSRAGPGRRPPSTLKPLAPPWEQGGGRRGDPGGDAGGDRCGARFPALGRPCLTVAPTVPPAEKRRLRQIGRGGRRLPQLDRPERPPDRREVPRLADFLVAQEFGPGAGGRVGEVLRDLAGGVPAAGRLGRLLPKKGETRVGVPERDQVAGEGARAPASSRTRCGPGSSGSQSAPSRRAGELPSSSFRGRSNQRRTPMSL